MSKTKIVIGYHADCIDGFTSAWVTYKALLEDKVRGISKEDIILFPCKYTPESEKELYNTCTEVGAAGLYIVDFSISVELIEKLTNDMHTMYITILDHHKTAFEKYAGLSVIDKDTSWRGDIGNAIIFLDNNECGASLCWKYFNPNSRVPKLIEYVKDYDLWRFEFGDDTKYINKVLSATFKTTDVWDRFTVNCEDARLLADILYDGKRMQEKHNELCEETAAKAVPITITGHKGLAVTCPRELTSDVGHLLAVKSGTFGALISVSLEDNKVTCSLRSEGDFDVTAIAKQFGGGGHKNAGGFSIPLIPEK